MKDVGTAYILWFLGFFCGICGVHRFYAGKPISGLIWLFTIGLLGFGQFIDIFLIPGMIDEANRRSGALGGGNQTVGQNVYVNVNNPSQYPPPQNSGPPQQPPPYTGPPQQPPPYQGPPDQKPPF